MVSSTLLFSISQPVLNTIGGVKRGQPLVDFFEGFLVRSAEIFSSNNRPHYSTGNVGRDSLVIQDMHDVQEACVD